MAHLAPLPPEQHVGVTCSRAARVRRVEVLRVLNDSFWFSLMPGPEHQLERWLSSHADLGGESSCLPI
jgi:hypothetical protein